MKEIKKGFELADNFEIKYISLCHQISDDIPLENIIEFCVYFRTDDVNLFYKYLQNYKYSGELNKSQNLIELYKEMLGTDDEGIVLDEFVGNAWNNGFVYHLTTDVDAENIMQNGMDPKAKREMIDDINNVKNMLSEETVNKLFPFVKNDDDLYYFSSIPNFDVSYGRCPEWLLNLGGYDLYENKNAFDRSIEKLKNLSMHEPETASKALLDLFTKYYEKYKDAHKVVVMIPNNMVKNILPEEVYKKMGTERTIDSVTAIMKNNVNDSSNVVIPKDDITCIDLNTRQVINYREYGNTDFNVQTNKGGFHL